MGAIYKAEDQKLDGRAVAIKEMSQSRLKPHEIAPATHMFEQEAKMLANLNHPNLPSIHDYFGEGGRWYLVMDFIEGTTLEERLNKAPGHVLSVEEALNICIQLTKVLGYLHTRPKSIIFRDLKPLNIMITPDDNVYLIDFGIARHFTPGKANDTLHFVSEGYAAPEQYGGKQTTPQSDIYSLGVILHQMLSGNDPQSNNPRYSFRLLQSYNSSLPSDLSNLVASMVNVDTARRPSSMEAVKQELERIQMQVNQEAHQSAWELSGRSTSMSYSPPVIEDDIEDIGDEQEYILPPFTPRNIPSIRPHIPSRPSINEDNVDVLQEDDEDDYYSEPNYTPPRRYAPVPNPAPSRTSSPGIDDDDEVYEPDYPPLPKRRYPQRPSYARRRYSPRLPNSNPPPSRRPSRVSQIQRPSRATATTASKSRFGDALFIGILTGVAAFILNLINFSITISFHLPWLTRLDIIPPMLFLLAGMLTGLIATARHLGFWAGAIAGGLFITLAFLLEPLKNDFSAPLYVSILIFALGGGLLGLLGASLVTIWHPSYSDI